MNLPPNWSWERLNDCYIRESGMESKPYLSKEFAWANWSRCGFTEAELIQTLRYLCREVKAGRRQPACKSFRTLIEQPANFEHELSLSKEEMLRNKSDSPKARVLREARHNVPQPDKCASAAQIIERAKLAEMLKQWKETNPL